MDLDAQDDRGEKSEVSEKKILSITLKKKIRIQDTSLKTFPWGLEDEKEQETDRSLERLRLKILKEGMTFRSRRKGENWELVIAPDQIESVIITTKSEHDARRPLTDRSFF